MDLDIIFLTLLWGMAAFFIVKNYLELSKEEQAEVKREIKNNPSLLLIDGFRYIGMMIFFSGIIASFSFLMHIGGIIIVAGWFIGGIELWEKNIKKSIAIISISMVFAIIYIFYNSNKIVSFFVQ